MFICIALYDPVCAIKDGEYKTYGNSCEAERDGAKVISKGECKKDNKCYGGNLYCPMIYDPVCAEKDGEYKTYGNSCEALKECAKVVYKGECNCKKGFYCGKKGETFKTYNDICDLEKDKANLVFEGSCTSYSLKNLLLQIISGLNNLKNILKNDYVYFISEIKQILNDKTKNLRTRILEVYYRVVTKLEVKDGDVINKYSIFYIRLEGNPSTGYEWSCEVIKGDIKLLKVDLIDKYKEKELLGRTFDYLFTFFAGKNGEGQIKCIYKNPYNNEKPISELNYKIFIK